MPACGGHVMHSCARNLSQEKMRNQLIFVANYGPKLGLFFCFVWLLLFVCQSLGRLYSVKFPSFCLRFVFLPFALCTCFLLFPCVAQVSLLMFPALFTSTYFCIPALQNCFISYVLAAYTCMTFSRCRLFFRLPVLYFYCIMPVPCFMAIFGYDWLACSMCNDTILCFFFRLGSGDPLFGLQDLIQKVRDLKVFTFRWSFPCVTAVKL